MDTQYKNFKYPIWNTQLSQKEVGKYPIASNPYLELWDLQTKEYHIIFKIITQHPNICIMDRL